VLVGICLASLSCKSNDLGYVKPGIFIKGVGVRSPGGTLGYVWKEGVLDSEWYGVTAAHLFDDRDSVEVLYPERGMVIGKVVAVKPEVDLAIIRFYGRVDTEECNGFAFPFETPLDLPVRQWPVMRSSNGDCYVRVDVTYTWLLKQENPKQWMLAARVWGSRVIMHHDSGSGVYDQSNQLLGIMVKAFSLDNTGSCYGYMVGSPAVREFIDEWRKSQ